VPADIATTNDRPAIMFTGPTPWHRLGTRLDHPATAAEAITAAGLDYSVDLQPLRTLNDLHVPRRKAVVRSDTRQVLGVVSKGYTPIQNRECFNFMDQLAAGDEVAYHTAGAHSRTAAGSADGGMGTSGTGSGMGIVVAGCRSIHALQ